MSKLYNDEWMRANGLLATTGAVVRVARAPRATATTIRTGRRVVLARTTERVGEAIDTLQQYGISQMPVSEDAEGDAVAGIVGSISEKGLLDRAFRDPVGRRADGRRGDGPAAAAGRRVGVARRCVRAAVRRRARRSSRSAASGRPAS